MISSGSLGQIEDAAVTDQLGVVMGVNASTAHPTGVILDLDPMALANLLGAGPMAVSETAFVVHDTDQAVDVAGFDESAVVAAANGGVGDDAHRQEVAPTLVDHGQHSGFPDPPTGIPSLTQQTTLEPTVVAGTETAGDLLTTTTLANLDFGLVLRRFHKPILPHPCLCVNDLRC